MDNKKNEIAANLQECLYSNILPPPPKLCNSIISRVLESHQVDSSAADWSDSEHTKSSQDRKDECFRMTTSRHSERSVPCGHPDSYGSPSACLRLKQESTCHENNKIERHPEFISGSVPFAQSTNEQAQSENLSEIVQSDHPQDIQMLKQVQHDGYSLSNTLTKLAKTAVISLALSFFITAPAMAQDPVPVPTDNHAYTLTKVEQAGVNTITKYEWSDTENKNVPVNYRVDLKQTDYGYPEIADDKKTFTVTTPNADGSGNAFEYEIKYYVDSSRLAPDRITTEQNGTDINNDFVGLNVTTSSSATGGAIYNYGSSSEIGDLTGDFIGNYASSNNDAYGGAIYNSNGTIGNITDDFISNYASSVKDEASGGAIYNTGGTIGNITGDFIGNYATSSSPGAFGGAIANIGITGNITGDFIGNYVTSDGFYAIGGAIANLGYIGTMDEQNMTITEGEIKNSSFIGNYAESKTGNAIGGAIFSTNKISIVADNGQSIFSGNKTISNGVEEQNALGMYGIAEQDASTGEYAFVDVTTGATSDKNTANLKLEAKNNGVIVFDDTIRGGAIDENTMAVAETPETAFDLKVTGDSTGKVVLNNDVINANISLDNTNLYLGREDVFDKSVSLSLNSGSIYLNNNAIGTMHVPTLNLNGNTNISVDADLANKSMDRITADNYNITNDAKLNVNNVVLLSDAKEDVTNILFADTELKGSVAYTGVSPIAYSPIYKYEVTYNPDDGFFTFARGSSSSGNPSDNYNPAVLAPSVTQQAGAYTTQLQTFNFAFQHADTFMNIPYMERLSIIEQGKYALSPTGDATDVGTYSPLMIKQHDPGFWVKPYASFENIPLKNGPKVSNINYGTLIGYDTPIKEISNGFERVLTGYIGYNGASQRYSGVDAYQNGGLLGGTATFYKGNFFNATTLSVGATAGDATTMYGSENYTMLLAGLGNKTGYNFEFFNGGMILQPSMLISYTFVNTFDYTNGAGVRIESDPLHAIQLSPGLKLIGNTKNGWQPYIGVNMVWNLLDDSKVTANDVRLPEMSIKPYVQYGVGIQKRFKDRFLAFGQAMIHNGGRNGVSLTAGLRWKVGKE